MLVAKTPRFFIYASAVFWLCVFMIPLVAMGVCYSIEAEVDMALVAMPGKVLIPDILRLRQPRLCQAGREPYSIPAEETIWKASDPLTFCGVNCCEYIFRETSTNSLDGDDGVKPLIVSTNRKINSTPSCEAWRVKSGSDGTKSRIAQDSDSQPGMLIPIQGGINKATFMANTSLTWGAGCSAVSALEVGNEEAWFYACNVSVGHILGGSRHEREPLQYQIYQAESVFGLPVKGYASTMEMIVKRFAIGTVAISAQGNPQVEVEVEVEVDGLAPVQGVHLVIGHYYANLTLISITIGRCSGAGGKADRYSSERVHRRSPGAPADDESKKKKQHEQ
ncbi:hypothetical protein FALBO_11596 [Fusarium albosuccineum]|uniref:Transmembrane protein n=1 Tax=Fusarium albosuccineum TaxID=1237068 RepID=A0A8H4L3I4_9HYPO|nr:hypothetical protein FALBO_11596 [Fusarium albosuccineum]